MCTNLRELTWSLLEQTDEIAETKWSVQSIFHSCMDQGRRRRV